jgi:hypothetical protein
MESGSFPSLHYLIQTEIIKGKKEGIDPLPPEKTPYYGIK